MTSVPKTDAPTNAKPGDPDLSSPELDGLVKLSNRDGVDIRPTLLRVITDLYLQKTDHTAEEAQQEAPVGTPGQDFGATEIAPEITADGDSPRCVN